MPPPVQVSLEPGKVYRTADFRRWSANPRRLASRLEREGLVRRLGHGLYYAPRKSRFGPVPPTDQELLDRLLDGSPWVLTGPTAWNSLALGSTALFARTLVYNTKRTGLFELGNRTFDLRRVAFPRAPSAEWYVIDLLRHADEAGVARDTLERHLARALAARRFDPERLSEMAVRFGTRAEQDLLRRAMAEAA